MNSARRITKCTVIALAVGALVLLWNPLKSWSQSALRQGQQSIYSVTDGKETISIPILYAFGQGKAGQTYMLEMRGKYYESRVSFYNEVNGLDYTLGSPRAPAKSLERDLKTGDIEIYEDGVKQEISSLRFVNRAGEATVDGVRMIPHGNSKGKPQSFRCCRWSSIRWQAVLTNRN